MVNMIIDENYFYTWKVLSNEIDPTFENFEKSSEFIESYDNCPCRAIRKLKERNDFIGYILNK